MSGTVSVSSAPRVQYVYYVQGKQNPANPGVIQKIQDRLADAGKRFFVNAASSALSFGVGYAASNYMHRKAIQFVSDNSAEKLAKVTKTVMGNAIEQRLVSNPGKWGKIQNMTLNAAKTTFDRVAPLFVKGAVEEPLPELVFGAKLATFKASAALTAYVAPSALKGHIAPKHFNPSAISWGYWASRVTSYSCSPFQSALIGSVVAGVLGVLKIR